MNRLSVRDAEIDLSMSMLNEDESTLEERVTVEGSIVLNNTFQILPIVSAFLTQSLRTKKKSISTIKTYSAYISYFVDYLSAREEFKSCSLDEALLIVQPHIIEQYFVALSNSGISSSTIRTQDAALMALFNQYICIDIGTQNALRSDNPYENGLLSNRPRTKLIEHITFDELRSSMMGMKSERDRLTIQFMFDSGVRRAEICEIRVSQIDKALEFTHGKQVNFDGKIFKIPQEYGPLFLMGVKGRDGSGKPRYTIVSKPTLERIKKFHSTPWYRKNSRKFGKDPYAFLNSEGNQFKPDSVSKFVVRAFGRVVKAGKVKQVKSAHKLRHGFAYSVLGSYDLGNDYIDRLAIVQKALGHEQLRTTEGYSQVPMEIMQCYQDKNGNRLTRAELMARLTDETRLVNRGD